jgi:hypothetical protein
MMFGILPSISNSWYKLPDNRKRLFTYFCLSIGLLMMYHGGISFFLSAAGLTFTGIASEYESKGGSHTNIVHFVGAGVCIVSALLGLVFEYQMIIPILSFVTLTVIAFLLKIKNKLWWLEIIAFLSIMVGLLFIYL